MAAEDAGAEGIFGIVDRLPSPALVADDNGRLLHANPLALGLLRVDLQSVCGHTIAEFVAEPFDAGEAWERFAREQVQDGELELRVSDGTTVPVHFSAVRNFGPGVHLSILTDLGPRRRVETILRRSEELYAKTFNLTPAPTNVRRLADGAFIEVNQAFTDVTGYWRSDILGRTARSVGLWADPRRLEAMLDELRGGATLVRARAELVVKDRSRREFSVAMRRAEIHNEPHVVAVYTDMALL